MQSGEYVLVCVAWPYANERLHLGHVAGCYLPPDIQIRFERALGNRVLMVSGSDEHGTPITLTAEQLDIDPQTLVDRYHRLNTQALLDLGCCWEPNIDSRGPQYGGALFNRTSDMRHKELVQENFQSLLAAELFEKKTMEQYFELRDGGEGRFLPDRYVEGRCPACDHDGARGDQCDECGTTYEAAELNDPRSKLNPDAEIVIKGSEHLFYRLDLFQEVLEQHAAERHSDWKNNVRAMTKNWLDMRLRPRAVTRDLDWGIELPLEGDEWKGKCVYVWFEAVQGYYTCARIWSERHASPAGHPDGAEAWENWWRISSDGVKPRHLYFLGKDNIPFHTVIWPAIIMGLNHARSDRSLEDGMRLPAAGELALGHNVPAMEFLMLAGGQFSKSRKHAIWLPSFLERYDPDCLRYYLSINMPENHDTDFNWPDFVERVNSELIATYGNLVHRVMTLSHRLGSTDSSNPVCEFDIQDHHAANYLELEALHAKATESLTRHRFKEALRHVMAAAQLGNQVLQSSAPWSHLKSGESDAVESADARTASLSSLAFGWRLCRFLAITTQPFMPFQAQRLWEMLGEKTTVSTQAWSAAVDWQAKLCWNPTSPQPLFERLDLEAILSAEHALAEISEDEVEQQAHSIKGGKKSSTKKEIVGVKFLDFQTFQQVELRVGRIVAVEDHPDADKLYVVSIDDGSEAGRTVCAGLKEYYSPEEMQGKQIVFVANLEPRKLRGVMSEGMLLAADDADGSVRLVTIDGTIAPGSAVR